MSGNNKPVVNNLPFVSVIIPVYNDRERLKKCLCGLACQDYPRDLYEVLVVDNASTELIEDLVQEQGENFRYLLENKRGSYAARNKGISVAKGHVLAFTDADCIPQPGWLTAGVKAITSHHNIGSVGGHIEVSFIPGVSRNMFSLYDYCYAFRQGKLISKTCFAVTANMFTRRDVVERVGPFDCELMSGGDMVWGNKVHQTGLELSYCADAIVIHPPRDSYKEHKKQIARVAAGKESMRIKHGLPDQSLISRLRQVRPPIAKWIYTLTNFKKLNFVERLKVCMALWIIRQLRFLEGLKARKHLLQNSSDNTV